MLVVDRCSKFKPLESLKRGLELLLGELYVFGLLIGLGWDSVVLVGD